MWSCDQEKTGDLINGILSIGGEKERQKDEGKKENENTVCVCVFKQTFSGFFFLCVCDCVIKVLTVFFPKYIAVHKLKIKIQISP